MRKNNAQRQGATRADRPAAVNEVTIIEIVETKPPRRKPKVTFSDEEVGRMLDDIEREAELAQR